MVRPAPTIRAIAVGAILVHAWTGFAFCRADRADATTYLGWGGCCASVPHSHEGHDEYGEDGSHEGDPWGYCPTPRNPHSHDLVLGVFSSNDGPVLQQLAEPADGLDSPDAIAASGSAIGNFGLDAALFPGGPWQRESSVPRYARLEVFLL